MKTLLKFCQYSFIMACIITSLIYALISTHIGTQLVFNMIKLALPGDLSVKNMSGKLIDEITINDLVYRDAGTTMLAIKNLKLSLSFAQLWQAKIAIREFKVNNIIYDMPDSRTYKNDTKQEKSVSNHQSTYHAILTLLNHITIQHINMTELNFYQQHHLLHQVSQFSLQNTRDAYLFTIKSSLADVHGKLQLIFNHRHDLNWDMVINGEHIHPELIAPNQIINGELAFSLTSKGSYHADNAHSVQMQCKLNSLNGVLNRQPVHGNAFFSIEDNQIHIADSQLTIGDAIVKIAGSLTNKWDFAWKIHLPDLHQYFSAAEGSLLSEGTISGKTHEPHLYAILKAENIIIDNYPIKEVNLQFKAQAINDQINFHIGNGNIYLQKLALPIQQINLTGNYLINQAIHFNGQFATEKNVTAQQYVKINGAINFHEPMFALHLNLTGTDILIANLSEYRIKVSPNMNIAYHQDQGATEVRGDIVVPSANIAPHDFSATVSLPDDVVYVNQAHSPPTLLTSNVNDATSKANNLALNLKITLGDKVNVDYANLHAQLRGNLTITQMLGSPMIASGEFHTINGKYQAYGKLLTIDQGRLIYTGNLLTNPGLDIRAVTKIKNYAPVNESNKNLQLPYVAEKTISVGIIAQGTLNKPKINLFSDPPGLSPNDILSYMIFGYPQSKIYNSNNLVLLNQLVANLKIGKYNNAFSMTEKVKDILGLSELNIGSMKYFDAERASFENATIVSIGKQFGRKLFVHYTTGVFQPISILSLKYQINKRLALKSETSSLENGADIVYEFEKD